MNLTTLGLLFASVIAGAIVVEIFKPKKFPLVDLSSSKLLLSESEKNLLLLTYQLEIDETRLLLNSKF